MNSTRRMLERIWPGSCNHGTTNRTNTARCNPRQRATILLSCDNDHVAHVESLAVRIAHVNGVVIGSSFFCRTCNRTVVVPSPVHVLAALSEFGAGGLRLVEQRFMPTLVSDARRLLSMRLLVDHVLGEIVDPVQRGRAGDDRLFPDVGLIPS